MYIFITPPCPGFSDARGTALGPFPLTDAGCGRCVPALAPPAGGAAAGSSSASSRPSAGSMAWAAALAACLEAVLGSRGNANRVFEILELLAVRAGAGGGPRPGGAACGAGGGAEAGRPAGR